jgi:hypothetical protein
MKLKNVFAIPFTLAADVVTLGNMGGPSFTQQLMNKDTRERDNETIIELLKVLADAKK